MSNHRRQLLRDYKSWIGMPVFVSLLTGDIKTALFCTIIGVANTTVRVRIDNQWDVDIYKDMILDVCCFSSVDMGLARQDAAGPAGVNI